MNIPLIDLSAQYKRIKQEIDIAVQAVIESAQFVDGKAVTDFENDFSKFCETKYGIATSSGSAALDLILLASGIGKGDEVITTPTTFIATTEAISHAGANIVFADIEDSTFNINPKEIERKITPRTKAIIPVHLFGHPCDMGPILEIAKKYGITVLEDCAQAHGAEYEGKKVGSFGNAACFSFYPGKNLGAYGHAGMVVTSDETIAKRVRLIANHGRAGWYEHLVEGYNYRPTSIQTSVLNVKLKYLTQWNDQRAAAAKLYASLLNSIVDLPEEKSYAKHVYHLFVIRTIKRDELATWLNSRGISTGIHYPIPLHLQPAYKWLGYGEGSFPIAEEFCSKALSIPMFPELTEEQIKFTANEIKEWKNRTLRPTLNRLL